VSPFRRVSYVTIRFLAKKIAAKFSAVGSCGIQCGGRETISRSFWNDDETSQVTGARM